MSTVSAASTAARVGRTARQASGVRERRRRRSSWPQARGVRPRGAAFVHRLDGLEAGVVSWRRGRGGRAARSMRSPCRSPSTELDCPRRCSLAAGSLPPEVDSRRRSPTSGGRARGRWPGAAVVAVEAGALEHDADGAEHLAQPSRADRAHGQRVVGEALTHLELLAALGAGVLVDGHGQAPSGRAQKTGLALAGPTDCQRQPSIVRQRGPGSKAITRTAQWARAPVPASLGSHPVVGGDRTRRGPDRRPRDRGLDRPPVVPADQRQRSRSTDSDAPVDGDPRRPRHPADLRRHQRRPVLRPGLRPGAGPLLRDGLPPPRDRPGRLAELFGDDALETDKFVRTMGWRRVAERELPLLSTDTRRYLESYSAGVNAYLADHDGARAVARVRRTRSQRRRLHAREVDAGRLARLAEGDGVGPRRQHRSTRWTRSLESVRPVAGSRSRSSTPTTRTRRTSRSSTRARSSTASSSRTPGRTTPDCPSVRRS